MMLIKLLITSTLILFYSYTLTSAQTPTTSIRDQVKQQVADELSQIKNTISKKAYVGSIASKVDATITITNLKNQPRTATVTTDTAIKLSGGKDGTPADLKVGDFVIAMGDADNTGQLTAKRLLVVSKPAEDKRRVLSGTVTKISSSSLTLETSDKKSETLKISSVSKYTAKSKLSDIKVGTKLVLVASDTTLLLAHLLP